MKITRYMGAFAVIAMLAACSTDDEQSANTAANEVKIAATIGGNSIFTRSNPLGTKAEQESFNENDAISVTTEGKTVVYTKNKDGQWANANDYLVWTGNAQTFEACYPGNSTNSISEGHIEADQSDITKIAQSDYMTCTENVTKIPDTRQLTLNFERQTARVIIKVSAFGDEFEGLNPTLSAVEVYSKLKVPAEESDSYVGIQACKKEENGSNVFYALVSPGAAKSTQNFLKLTVTYNDGEGNPTQTKELYVTGIPALEKAMSYAYDVKIGKDKATIGRVSVADWGNGDPIKGGDASTAVTVASVKESVAKQLENGNDVELTLPSNASLGLFEAIKTALKDKGVPKSSVDITLKGVMRIPQKAFGNLPEGVAPWFNVVRLPDATIIDDYAFQGSTLTEIYAPKVEEINDRAFYLCHQLEIVDMRKASRIKYRAFEDCTLLERVRFGALSSAGQLTEDGMGGIFDWCQTNFIDLTLSSRQSMMQLRNTAEATCEWVPAGESYWDTEDYERTTFLGYKFNKIICADD